MKHNVLSFIVPACLLLVPACDLDPFPVGEDHETSSTGDEPPGTGGPASSGPGGGETSESDGPGSSGTSGSSGDDPGTSHCDPLVQDCADAEGCYPEGDEFACSGPSGEAQSGDECAVDEDCATGLFCDVDQCRPFCDISDPTPCDDPGQACEPWYPEDSAPPGLEDVGFCADAPITLNCDPVLQDCADGDGCYPAADDTFACQPGAGPAQSGDACIDNTDCDVGLWCDVDQCAAFCDLSGIDECLDPDTECIPWFPERDAPPGLEHVGSCGSIPVGGPDCDPLLQDCAAGDGCYPNEDGAQCEPTGPAQNGDVCGAGCDIGLVCLTDVCHEICDTAAPECSDGAADCIDYHAPGAAPPGHETVGYCTL